MLNFLTSRFHQATPEPNPKKTIRLSIVTQFYPPDFAATGQFMDELATNLSQQGLEVHVFTGQPSYAVDVNAPSAPAEEIKAGVHITRSSFLRTGSRKMLGRTLSNFAFCLHAAWHLLNPQHRGDLVLFTSEPPYSQVLGFILKLLFGTAYASLVYDLYPDVIAEHNILPEHHWVMRLWDGLNRLIWQQADIVIVPCQTMKDRIVAKHPSLCDRITVIHNWSDPTWIKPLAKSENTFAQTQDLADTFTVLYSGNMGRCHDMDTVLGAAQALRDEPIQFLFIGGGPKREAAQQYVQTHNLTTCRFLPYQDKTLLPQSLTACDLHLVSIDAAMEGLVAPSKFYSALASGRPVAIICERHSYLRELVSDANCGAAFLNGDSQGLASFIRYLKKDPDMTQRLGLSGHRYVHEYFTPQLISQQYYRLIHRAVVKNADLYAATENGEFEMYYQPVVHLGNGRELMFEAIIRWHHPDRGVLCPADFLVAAEETNLIIPIGWQAINHICQTLAYWQPQYPDRLLRISLNLSSRQFFHPELIPCLDQALAKYGLTGDHLILEISDRMIMADTSATLGILVQLKSRNIDVCIDDFGLHYSALSFLHRMPVSILKVHPSIINRLDVDTDTVSWLSSLIGIARDLNITLIGQGVDTAFQHRRLRELGLTYGQGQCFAQPESANQIVTRLALPITAFTNGDPLPDEPAPPPTDTPLVLIVDDDRSLRSMLAKVVTLAGYRAIEASNGVQGIQLYQQAQPNLVLLDAVMPEMDGFTCCRQLRSLQQAEMSAQVAEGSTRSILQAVRQVPIVMITALDDTSSIEKAFAAGAVDYMTKPMNWAILKERLKQYLS